MVMKITQVGRETADRKPFGIAPGFNKNRSEASAVERASRTVVRTDISSYATAVTDKVFASLPAAAKIISVKIFQDAADTPATTGATVDIKAGSTSLLTGAFALLTSGAALNKPALGATTEFAEDAQLKLTVVATTDASPAAGFVEVVFELIVDAYTNKNA